MCFRVWPAVLFLVCPGILSADTLIKREVTADSFATPSRIGLDGPECEITVQKPQSGDEILIYLGQDRVRRDQRDLTIILRQDRKRLLLLYPQIKKYSELKLPIKYERFRGEMADRLPSDLFEYSIEQISDPEAVTIGEWNATRQSAIVGNKMNNKLHVTFAYSDAIELEIDPLIRFETIVHRLTFISSGWLRLLPGRNEFPILWEQNVVLPSSEVLYREQVTKIEEVETEDGFYDVPEGFKKIAFEHSCIQLP